MKINCDLGEGLNEVDALLIPLVDQANIACGAHAGDDASILRCIKLADQHQTEIGIHPSYRDRENFGRLSLAISRKDLALSLRTQILHFIDLCNNEKLIPRYVKPHGALYNDLANDNELLVFYLELIAEINNTLPAKKTLATMLSARLNNQPTQDLAKKYKVEILFEAFADRAYSPDGSLIPRNVENAVFTDADKIVSQYDSLSQKSGVHTSDGEWINLNANSICMHGDNPAVPQAIQLIKRRSL